MSISVVCSRCRKKGFVPDKLSGRSIRCTNCQHQFVARSAGTKAAPSASRLTALIDEDDSPVAVLPLMGRSPRSASNANTSTSLPAAYVAGGVGAVCGLLLMVMSAQFLAPRGSSPLAEPKAIEEPLPDPSPRLIHSAPPPPPPVPVPDGSTSLAWLEDATVFLKLKIGKAVGSGTGFVIRMQGDTALIATNRHVVTPDLDDEEGARLEITAVFRSGKGPDHEESLPAEIVAIDSGEEINHDLALLRVRGLKRPVTPIDVNRIASPTLRMIYAAYGFPLPMIKFNQGNPTITVTGGQVSTLRNDDMGQLFAIQLDGSLQPGNSGGPIADDRGRLIGVAVAKLEGVDTIGLAIPADELRELLAGRVGAIDLDVRNSKSPQPDLRVRAQVVDPNGRIKAVKVLVAPAQGAARLVRRGDGSWPPIPGASPVDLKMDRSVATGEVKVALGKAGAEARRVLIQTAHLDSTGKLRHSRPRPYNLGNEDGKIVGGRKIEELRRKLARQSLRRLGPLVEDDDPKTADECRLARDEKDRKSSIALPAKLFSLSPKVVKQ
jgi:S1-C subfamily serine protease